MFQQDCAPVYKANSKKTWFDQFSVEELKRPAQSLDLNPTGKPLHLNPTVHHWDELESQLWVRSFHSTPVLDQMGTDSQRYTSKSWEKPSQKSGGCFGSIGSVSILMFWNEKSNNLISLWMSGIQNGYYMQLLHTLEDIWSSTARFCLWEGRCMGPWNWSAFFQDQVHKIWDLGI